MIVIYHNNRCSKSRLCLDLIKKSNTDYKVIEYLKEDLSVDNIKEMVDGLPDHKDEWLGFRPTLPDFLPIIGPSKNYKNVYYCFGHHHLGWTLGAISGKIISNMIAEQNTNLDLKPYSSLRFA